MYHFKTLKKPVWKKEEKNKKGIIFYFGLISLVLLILFII